jgi:4-amino-4-deoxy-L-arabinose transferase
VDAASEQEEAPRSFQDVQLARQTWGTWLFDWHATCRLRIDPLAAPTTMVIVSDTPRASTIAREPAAARRWLPIGAMGSLLVACGLLAYALAFQGSRALWEPDEGRYVAIAARMLRSGDFIVPAFNAQTPHFAKPPLTYWAIAAGLKLCGWNEWGARLANALAFVATVLVVYALAKRLTPRRAWLPPLAYATFPLPFLAANMVTTDTLLALFEAVGVLGFVDWWRLRGQTGGRRARWLMWLGFALAFLTKGPPSLLPLLAIFTLAGMAEGKRAVRGLFSIEGLATFAVVGLGWYALVALTHPGLATYFLHDEVWRRIASADAERNPQWYGPFTVYAPALLLGTLPWTGSLRDDVWLAFLAVWIVLPLVVLSLSRSRLPLYVVPLCVPLALCLGACAGELRIGRVRAGLLVAWTLLLVGTKAAAAFYPYERSSLPMARAIEHVSEPAPSNVVFLDCKPFWGVGFYLHCDVQYIDLHDAHVADEAQALSAELARGTPQEVLVVKAPRAARAEAALAQLGYESRRAGEFGSLVILASTRRSLGALER